MNKPTILAVDDSPNNLRLINAILEDDYRVRVATSGELAFKIAKSEDKPSLILLNEVMPYTDGYEICRKLKQDNDTKEIPVIFVTSGKDTNYETKGFEVGAVDFIIKPMNPVAVRSRVNTHVKLYNNKMELERQINNTASELRGTQREILNRLMKAVEFRDNETGMHITRMGAYSAVIARRLNLSKIEVEIIYEAAMMHDLGKIGLPDNVLFNTGKLTDEEWGIMKTHCEIGYRILKNPSSQLGQYSALGALTHHEKWDGTGYPRGLKGTNIPLIGRIIAVADVFDALVTDRPYKKAWGLDEAIEYIKSESNRHFDPVIVDAFIEGIDEVVVIKEKYKDE